MTGQIIVLFPHADGGRPEWPGFWAVASREDIAYISGHPELFSSARRLIAAPLPLQVICERVGAPAEDRGRICELSSHLVGADDPEFKGPDGERLRQLATLEPRIMLRALVERMPKIALDGKVSRLRSNFVNGIKHMPVRY